MDDLISRQDTSIWLERWKGYLDDDMILRMQIGLKDVPSAQQELDNNSSKVDNGTGDLIRRQDAIDAICGNCSMTKASERCTDDFCADVRALKEVPSAQKKGEWIPCSERLPEEDGHYLVYAPCYFFGSSSGKENHNGIMFSKYKNGKWSIEHGYYQRPNCVKAWMPLLEPYEEGEKE